MEGRIHSRVRRTLVFRGVTIDEAKSVLLPSDQLSCCCKFGGLQTRIRSRNPYLYRRSAVQYVVSLLFPLVMQTRMSERINKVTLVLEPDFGERLASLAAISHVWVID